jgi:NADH-quinone oxidoreductase subunit N
MIKDSLLALVPELALLVGALVLFVVSLGEPAIRRVRRVALATALVVLVAAVFGLGREGILFDGAYQVDGFSQFLKLIFGLGLVLLVMLSGDLPDIRPEVKSEYLFFLTLSVCGLTMLVSCVDILTLVIALQLSSFPLYLLVPMRREAVGRRGQMESAMKYLMLGIAANGIMLFGMSYLFGLTGTTRLPEIFARLAPWIDSPVALAALAMTFAGILYKLAVFPFHFWTPDVYQGASNETAGLIASLPKVGAVAVLVRFVSLASPEHESVALLLAVLATASMFYGNLIALVQDDLKRLLGFSGIAHAGYALIGFVALDQAGFTAALYYIIAYLFMVVACFIVVCQVSTDGANLRLGDLAGLHRRAPLLAVTLGVGIFALAGMPPFAGFMGKLALLKAALAKGYLALVILAVINTAIAAYYYLGVIREAFFREAGDRPLIHLGAQVRVLCLVVLVANIGLGVLPGRVLETIGSSMTGITGLDRESSAMVSVDPEPGRGGMVGAGQAGPSPDLPLLNPSTEVRH